MVRIPFFIKEDCPAVFFRFESASAGYRIDDPALEEGDGTGETITFLEDVVNYIRTVLWEDDFAWANNAAYVKSDAWTGSDGTRIDKWSNYPSSTNGWTIESGRATSYPRSAGSASATGFLKSGWADGGAGLFSPKLEAIGSEARDVTVELTLASWTLNNKPDNDQLCIRVLGGGTIGNASSTEQVFSVGSWNEWAVHEFEIFGATAATQIYIGSTAEANNRWFIDRFRLIYITEKPGDFKPETHDRPRVARIRHRRRRQTGEGDGQRRLERPQRGRMAVVRTRRRRCGNFDGDDHRRSQPDRSRTPLRRSSSSSTAK